MSPLCAGMDARNNAATRSPQAASVNCPAALLVGSGKSRSGAAG